MEFEEEIDGIIPQGQLLKNVLEIESWCRQNYGDKEIWDRKLPRAESKDEEEKRLGIALLNLRQKLKQYEGKKNEDIEDENVRKIAEIIEKLDEEYAFGRNQLDSRNSIKSRELV